MTKFKVVFIIGLVLILVALLIFWLLGFFRPKGAGLLIETTPEAIVFIDGAEVGTTPYEETRSPGEIFLKLVSRGGSGETGTFETKLNLTSGIQTIVRRYFVVNETEISGEIISFEKMGGKEAGMAIVTEPDAAQISIDGLPRGFSPYKISSISEGDHQIKLSAPGYTDKTLFLKTKKGYKLVLVVKLAQNSGVNNSGEPPILEENLESENMVKILPTPNNFLRVRKEPTTDSVELARVESGQSYPLISESDPLGWYKIEYEKGQEGWISSEYAQKIEE